MKPPSFHSRPGRKQANPATRQKTLYDTPLELSKYGITAQHPDEFLTHVLDLAPGVVCGALRTVRARLTNPTRNVATYLQTLEQQALTQFVSDIQQYASLLYQPLATPRSVFSCPA